MAQRRIRIGIDTGGTFTDVVAFDEDSGELVTTKTPSTPSNPADGFINGIDKVLGLMEASGDDITAVCHGTTVATNKLLEGKVEQLGFITTEGYEFMLEIARQAVPDGYGNSYFWVKPDRIVPRHLVKGVEGRMDFEGHEVRPFDEQGAREVARWFRAQGINTLGVSFLHAYANSAHEELMRQVLAEEHPDILEWENLNKYAQDFATSESGGKGQFLGADPSYVQFDEAIVSNLDLDFQVVFSGSEAASITAFQQAEKNKEFMIGYFYEPQWLFAELELQKVNLPPYEDGCQDDPQTVACDYPETELKKIVSTEWSESDSTAVDLVQNFTWTNEDQNVVAGYIASDGMSPEDAAAKWIEENQDKVDAWLG